MDKISVLIADDHTLFRKGVRKMLEAEEGEGQPPPPFRLMGNCIAGKERL